MRRASGCGRAALADEAGKISTLRRAISQRFGRSTPSASKRILRRAETRGAAQDRRSYADDRCDIRASRVTADGDTIACSCRSRRHTSSLLSTFASCRSADQTHQVTGKPSEMLTASATSSGAGQPPLARIVEPAELSRDRHRSINPAASSRQCVASGKEISRFLPPFVANTMDAIAVTPIRGARQSRPWLKR